MSQVRDQTQNALVTNESPFLMISLVYHTTSQKAIKSALQFCYKCVTKQNKPRNLGLLLISYGFYDV